GFEVLLVDTNYKNISAARMEGLPCRCASIVSEYMEELDLGGIGQLMAMTPNDDLNRLAVVEFESVFGRASVFQLPPDGETSKRRDPSAHMKGRYLFASDAHFETMNSRYAAGARVKKTKLSDEFTYDDFLDANGQDSLLMFVISDNGVLSVITADDAVSPHPGDTVVSMVSTQRNAVAG
ncbi:MAG: sodium:proton exchanger, partial [Planctomycetales bacterium]|nr:sodium:proton exchanger [Planctomycetales bacterium]